VLDTSASGDPFSFADLFLNGPQTLTEFQSYRPPNIVELRDPVLMTGPHGTSAAGRFLSLADVPPGAPGPLPILGVGAGLAWSRRLRRRIGGSSRGGRLASVKAFINLVSSWNPHRSHTASGILGCGDRYHAEQDSLP
jgi:hypothetical protein